ncbi:hypothetical protein [Escherichia coli]|uniref:hypothetical protein n=1 Tax=Escherichia coli TaxID=562 RepID=UPI003D9AA6C3
MQTRKFVCATVFFSVLICEEEIERPLTLYRWFSFRRGFIFWDIRYRHWIISVRLPYSERPPRPSRTFQQRIWR